MDIRKKSVIILVIIIALILIVIFNPVTQYLMAYNGNNRIRAENIILNRIENIKYIICAGWDLSIIDFKNNNIGEYYNKIKNKDIAIGYFNNNYIYSYMEMNFNNEPGKEIIKAIKKDFSEDIDINTILFERRDWIKLSNDLIYFFNLDGKLDIYKINENFKLIFKHHFEIEKSVEKTSLIKNQYLIYNISQKKPKNYDLNLLNVSNEKKDIIANNSNSFCVTEDGIYYNDKDGNLYKYNILEKESVELKFKIQYVNEKYDIIQAGELIDYKDDKLFFVTHHIDWEMPFKIISYYDLKEQKTIDVAKVIGAFNHFQIIFN